MISWAVMGYGAALSVLLAAALTAVPKPRQASVIVTAAVAAGVGALAWNAILHAAHGANFFTDAPLVILPASWQDTGSGVFAIAVACLALGFGPLAGQPGRRLSITALLAGIGAFLVDVYLY
jgi:hypothetical protein